MRVAILSDIHANREAFDAALEIVRDLGPDEIVLLGDLVGYGPDPVHAIETAAELVAGGALCILGNHDEAVVQPGRGMTENARVAAAWTRKQLAPAHLDFLRNLPLSLASEDRLYVHASADRPADWQYMRDLDAAERCLSSSLARTIICGHTHIPAIYYALPGKRPVHFRPHDDIPAPLSPLRRHVVVVGSVGQPRDGNPAACFALADTERRTVTMIRTPYDCDRTAGKIAACGLPAWLGMRLKIGR
ncbi:metallophosphoesterase family protein [Mesorhizobium sp. KR9-304]|uniref:metallophosphoesterase family protein n=1 Tax=Mesorhizobium sp. KR9-304 TaxID=3156614 RepID=UPI0032B3C3EA